MKNSHTVPKLSYCYLMKILTLESQSVNLITRANSHKKCLIKFVDIMKTVYKIDDKRFLDATKTNFVFS